MTGRRSDDEAVAVLRGVSRALARDFVAGAALAVEARS
jgi:hypothetical protein